MATIVAMDVNLDAKVRSRDTELLPSTEAPRITAWTDAGTLEEVLDRLDGNNSGLALMLMAASLEITPSAENVGTIVVQRHIVVEGKPVRIVEYELS